MRNSKAKPSGSQHFAGKRRASTLCRNQIFRKYYWSLILRQADSDDYILLFTFSHTDCTISRVHWKHSYHVAIVVLVIVVVIVLVIVLVNHY